jgi:hypothetical protein
VKKYILLSVTAFVVVPAWAAKINNPKCDDIVTINDKFTPEYLAVVDGFSKSDKKQGEDVDVGGIVTESARVKQECQKQKTKVMKAVQKEVAQSPTSPSTPSKINPVKANCEEFVALSEEAQPVAAYWVAGYDKSGKISKNGEVDEEFLRRPVLTLIEECKAHPKASFYSKAKDWFKTHI